MREGVVFLMDGRGLFCIILLPTSLFTHLATNLTCALHQPRQPRSLPHRRGAAADTSLPWREQYGAAALAALLFALWQYGRHANWASSEAYSSPSIVLISGYGANRYVLDDFR